VTPADFVGKLDWEGGLDYALTEMKVGDLPRDKVWATFRELYKKVKPMYKQLAREYERRYDEVAEAETIVTGEFE